MSPPRVGPTAAGSPEWWVRQRCRRCRASRPAGRSGRSFGAPSCPPRSDRATWPRGCRRGCGGGCRDGRRGIVLDRDGLSAGGHVRRAAQHEGGYDDGTVQGLARHTVTGEEVCTDRSHACHTRPGTRVFKAIVDCPSNAAAVNAPARRLRVPLGRRSANIATGWGQDGFSRQNTPGGAFIVAQRMPGFVHDVVGIGLRASPPSCGPSSVHRPPARSCASAPFLRCG